MAEIRPHKTVLEVRFRAKLEYFRLLDDIGVDMLETLNLENWARGDDSVYVIDRKNSERYGLEYERFFFESDIGGEPSNTAPTRGLAVLLPALERLGNARIQRVGIRQFFAVRVGRLTQQQLVARLMQRYKAFGDFATASNMSIDDISLLTTAPAT